MQPVQHGFFLQHARELGALGTRRAVFGAELRVPLDEPRATIKMSPTLISPPCDSGRRSTPWSFAQACSSEKLMP